MQLILLSEPVWIKICGEIDEISRKVLITGVIGYDSIRKHLHIKERIIPSYIHLTDMHIFLWDRGRRAKSISLLKKFLVTEHFWGNNEAPLNIENYDVKDLDAAYAKRLLNELESLLDKLGWAKE